MNDGSGLAPADKVSAGFMGELLVYMATESAVSDAFIASLPQAGIEGSVRNFLKGSKLQGKAHLKSGGITGDQICLCSADFLLYRKENAALVLAVVLLRIGRIAVSVPLHNRSADSHIHGLS